MNPPAVTEQWRRDALASLNAWHELEALVPKEFTHGRLGQPWPSIVAAYITHLETRLQAPRGNSIMSTREPTGDVRLDRIEQRLDEIGREVYSVHLNAECVVRRMRATDAEVLAALRMYRKVQGCRTAPNGDVIRPGAGNVLTAHILLAWLKEGEA